MNQKKREILNTLKQYAKEHLLGESIIWVNNRNQILDDNNWYYICISFYIEQRGIVNSITFSCIVTFLWEVDWMKQFQVETFEYRVAGYPMGCNEFIWTDNFEVREERLWEFFCEIKQRIKFYRNYMKNTYKDELMPREGTYIRDVQWYWNHMLYGWLFKNSIGNVCKEKLLNMLCCEIIQSEPLETLLKKDLLDDEKEELVQKWIYKKRKQSTHLI